MPFVQRRHISHEIRCEMDRKLRNRLREALLNPALTAEQRVLIKEELTMLENGGRIYDANRPPRPGAVSFDE